MRLNLGSGNVHHDGYLSVDFNLDFCPGLVADVRCLPFKDESVDEILAAHVLEHTTIYDNTLAEWHRILKPGGKITVAVPDLAQSLAFYRAGIWTLEYFTATIFGGSAIGKNIWGTHYQVFTSDMLLDRMRNYFMNVRFAADQIPHSPNYGEVVVQGVKE